ncbi:MAG: winged helix-turn-helix domain-containing protein [Planctomycetota bacterium]|jgi:molybdate transport system regulatory protein
MKLRGKVWIEVEGQHVFGRGRAALLEAIERTGSIQAAAAKLGLSYRHAWTMLKTSEQRWGRKLVETVRGGRGGGGARVTEAGRGLVRLFRRLEGQLGNLLEEQSVELEGADI